MLTKIMFLMGKFKKKIKKSGIVLHFCYSNVWLHRRSLDSGLCFCIQSLQYIILDDADKENPASRRQVEKEGPQRRPERLLGTPGSSGPHFENF